MATTVLDHEFKSSILQVLWSHDYWTHAGKRSYLRFGCAQRTGYGVIYELLIFNLLILFGMTR